MEFGKRSTTLDEKIRLVLAFHPSGIVKASENALHDDPIEQAGTARKSNGVTTQTCFKALWISCNHLIFETTTTSNDDDDDVNLGSIVVRFYNN
jgi:hypothetical protein